MTRLAIGMLTLAAGLAVGALAMDRSPLFPDATGAPRLGQADPTSTPIPPMELRGRATRWTCSVRHAQTGNYYRCTEQGEKKSCRCAIAKCRHWNPGQQRHCSSSCKCHKS